VPIRAIEVVEATCNPAAWADVPLDTSTHFRRVPVGPDHEIARVAEVELAGAEVLVRDLDSGKPILVRHRIGEGMAYLLTTWAYPGNAWLRGFVTEVVAGLAERTSRDVMLDDPSGDVYYTVRREEGIGLTRIHLLNTDWSSAGNEKPCRMRLGDYWVDVTIREGRLSEVIWCQDLAILIEDPKVFLDSIEAVSKGWSLTVHGYGNAAIQVCCFHAAHAAWEEVPVHFGNRSVCTVALGE
jgi:hypothetical protein